MERKLIAAAVSSALALPLAAQAVEFSASGHVNRAIISVDGGGPSGGKDAHSGDVQHVDSNASQTRFRFTGSEELENGMTAGVQLEYGASGAPNLRHANAYLSTAGGKITLGQQSTATDGMAHARLGGPSWLGGVSNWCAYASAGPACPSNDGGRSPVLRYDTPAIGPASIAVSAGDNDYFDVKLSVAGSMGDAGYDFRIGYIGKYDNSVNYVMTEAAERMAGMPAMAESETITGSMLFAALQDDNAPMNRFAQDSDGDGELNTHFGWTWTAASGTTPAQWIRDTAGPASNADGVQSELNAHIDGSEGSVLSLMRNDGGDATDVLTAAGVTYRKLMWMPGMDAVPAVAQVLGKRDEDAGDITTMSGAVSFGQGTAVAVAWSQQDTEAQVEYTYMELDHTYGDGSIGVYYKQGEYGATHVSIADDGKVTARMKGTEGSLWGIGIGHNLGSGATAYAGYRQMSEDGKNDVDLLLAGLRVTFN